MQPDPEELARELWPDAFGGVRQCADLLVVGFARDAITLGAELRRRTGCRLGVEPVPRSERELDQLQDRLWEDRDAVAGVGITLIGSQVEPRRGQVRLEVATEDPAAAMAWLAARYGPAIAIDVLGSSPTTEALAPIKRCRVAPDGCELQLTWDAGGGVRLLRIELDEHPRAVTIGAMVSSGYVVTADSKLVFADARLREPLGDRLVIDAGSGGTVPRTLT